MEIRTVAFEGKLVIIRNNQTIHLTPFLTQEPGNIKLGIEAPKHLQVNREEIYFRKKTALQQRVKGLNAIGYVYPT